MQSQVLKKCRDFLDFDGCRLCIESLSLCPFKDNIQDTPQLWKFLLKPHDSDARKIKNEVRERKEIRKTELQSDLCSERNRIIAILRTIMQIPDLSRFFWLRDRTPDVHNVITITTQVYSLFRQLIKWKLSDQA